MNLLNSGLSQFVNHGSDESILKSLNLQHNIPQDLTKSRSGLVQKEVTVRGKDGKTFTRKQWVNPNDEQTSDRVKSSDEPSTDNSSKLPDGAKGYTDKQTGNKNVVGKFTDETRQQVISQAEKRGYQLDKKTSGKLPDGNEQLSFSKKSQEEKANYFKADQNVKNKVMEMSSQMGNDKLLEFAKQNGITWKEHTHKGINIMRMKMALAEAITNDSSIVDKISNSNMSQTLAETQKKVAELTDIISSLQNPTAKQVADKDSKSEILKGIDVGTKSDYEKSHFGDIIDSASPESLRNYRTLGMCAGDAESEKYLEDLYKKYTIAVGGKSETSNSVKDNRWSDPIRDKLTGVVNASVAQVVKQSVKGMRKKCHQTVNRNSLLQHWYNPNAFSPQDIEDIKSDAKISHQTSLEMEQRRKDFAKESEGGEYTVLKGVLDKLNQHPDFKGLASEYKTYVEDFETATGGSSLIQEIPEFHMAPKNKDYDSIKKVCQDEIDKKRNWANRGQERIKETEEKIMRIQNGTSDWFQNYNPTQKEIDDRIARLQLDLKDTKRNVAKYTKLADEAQSIVDSPDFELRAKKASQAFEAMNDNKFEDINVNLQHAKRVSAELTRQYFCEKNFLGEYPILSKNNIDLLDNGDESAITNLALHAGMFKPSLSKGGKDAKNSISEKYAERQAYIEAYGGIHQVDSKEYAENNEIRCKVSKVDSKTEQDIKNKIKKDWDMSSHGNMKYKIKGVFEVSGLAVEKDFNEIKKANSKNTAKSGGKNCNSDFFYHGTGSMATSLILGHSGQFKLVKAKVGRMLGDGIYLADKSSKSGQYIGDSGYSRHGIEGSLMVVEASLGKTIQTRGAQSHNYNNGFDSVYAGKNEGLLNSEWCVRNPKAVIPRYLVQMEIV